jgi:hypothetical protein
MPIFDVTFFIEPKIGSNEEIEFEERVVAKDEEEALELARQKIAAKNPELDPVRATAWFIERRSP